MTKDAR